MVSATPLKAKRIGDHITLELMNVSRFKIHFQAFISLNSKIIVPRHIIRAIFIL